MKAFVNGQFLKTISIDDIVNSISKSMDKEICVEGLIDTLDLFSKELNDLDIDQEVRNDIEHFCSKKEIENKLICELGSLEPFNMKKRSFKEVEMESFYPLGTLLHITSANSEGLSFLALIEGLLAGNVNILKLSRRDSALAYDLVEKLLSCDKSGVLKTKIIILQDSNITIEELISISDGVSCWGGSAALNSIKELVPSSKRFITWGHKISFSLIELEENFSRSAKKLVNEIVLNNQQACSAPQVCYLLDANFSDLKNFSKELDQEFNKLYSKKNLQEMNLDIQQKAELTNINELLKLEALIENKSLKIGTDHQWRIYIEDDTSFKASPLNRSIWIKPIREEQIYSTFSNHRDFLQTAGLSISEKRVSVITKLLQAGVTRVRELGRMQESYSGEPHDGEYALRRFVKRVNVDLDILHKNYRLSERVKANQNIDMTKKVMSKEDFQKSIKDETLSHLFFRSGGSSGEPAISTFSYRSYHTQMNAAAEGLLAAGLEPRKDMCANLFFGGGLYGGFISFFTILEFMEARQLPLAAYEDKRFVAKSIVTHGVDTLLGMPSYLIDLFSECEDILSKGKVRKIYFGGEHFPVGQREILKKKFNIEVIRSASYGSVDAGPLGFQCDHCEGTEHHLNESIQKLEILKIDKDEAVEVGEVGRLVFTSKARESIKIERYDLGDLGREVSGDCPCGRKNLKFELLGRHGDIFRAGGTFYNYAKFQRILSEEFSYEDNFQIIITNENGLDRIDLYLNDFDVDEKALINQYSDLREGSLIEKTVTFSCISSNVHSFVHSPSSGKILRVIDKRSL